MKKILIILPFLFLNMISYGQFNMGVKGGVHLTSLNYDNRLGQRPINKEPKVGYLGGLTFQYFYQENLGLQFEALFIQKGFKTAFDSVSNTQYERTIDYLSVPFLFHGHIGKKNYSVSLVLGPYASYALQSREILTEGQEVMQNEYVYDEKVDNRFEFGLQGGIGLKSTFPFGTLEIQGQYGYSFTSLFKWDAVNPDPDKDRYFAIPEQAQNQGLQISLHYYYSF